MTYLAPTVEVHLPPATLKTELMKVGDSYRLKVSSPVLARSVYISFGDADAEVSDNYFDMLPGQSVEIMIKTKANEEALRKGLKVISLVDAFNGDAVAKSAPSTALADRIGSSNATNLGSPISSGSGSAANVARDNKRK